MLQDKFWMVGESNSDLTYYYGGYYSDGMPVFMMAIADAVQIANFDSAKALYNILNRILPCEVWLVEGKTISKVVLN